MTTMLPKDSSKASDLSYLQKVLFYNVRHEGTHFGTYLATRFW